MDIGVFSATPNAAADPAIIAKRAEELGFESYWVPDHPILPVGGEKDYPGAAPGEEGPAFLAHIPDPLIVLSRAGAVTTKLKLGTGVYLVPERHPIISAQQMATLDDATGSRFMLGIGAGWNQVECEMLGGDFKHRWGQTKDFIAAMRTLWQDEESANIAFLIQLWIVPIPAEFGGLEVEPLEELPEAVADLGERFVERKMFAEVILPLEPQVFCRVLFRGVGSKQQTRHGPLCLRYPRIFASQKLLHLGPPVIAGSIPQV